MKLQQSVPSQASLHPGKSRPGGAAADLSAQPHSSDEYRPGEAHQQSPVPMVKVRQGAPAIGNFVSESLGSQVAGSLTGGVPGAVSGYLAAPAREVADPKFPTEKIRLHFEVDPRYLALHTLLGRRSGMGSPEEQTAIEGYRARAAAFDAEACQFLRRYDFPVASLAEQGPLGERAEHLIAHLQADPAFPAIEAQAKAAAAATEREWKQDLKRSLPMMEEMTGIDFDMDLKVLITHPAQTNGMSWGRDKILWTHQQGFPHYNTVYLWHEIMHKHITASKLADQVGNPSHAVIELLTDNELRVRMGGGIYPPLIGHPENRPFQEQLLPSWRAFLEKPDKGILDYVKYAESLDSPTSGPASRYQLIF